jgi:hypothetical protein
VDAGKVSRRVWGISLECGDVEIYLNELLWQSGAFIMDLCSYEEPQVLQVYRIVHYIVTCSHEACITPPSTTSLVVSLDQ